MELCAVGQSPQLSGLADGSHFHCSPAAQSDGTLMRSNVVMTAV